MTAPQPLQVDGFATFGRSILINRRQNEGQIGRQRAAR
jgi:hypothetical protein